LPYSKSAAGRRLDDDGARVAHWHAPRRGGYRLGSPGSAPGAIDRLTIAIPAKGRLREPSVALLERRGPRPEQPGDRALAFPCRNAPVDVLLVRASDVPGVRQDGVVTADYRRDLVRERGASVEELLRLGFGACRLEAAVPEESTLTALADLSGATVATVYPRLAGTLLRAHGVEASLVEVSGSVEVAPRLGLADAIVDLVSSGSTLRTNGLRSLGVLFESEAVLVGRGQSDASDQLVRLLRPVVDARSSRYLMLNAPEDAIEDICRLVPGSRSRASCRSRSRAWSPCTCSCRPPRCGTCCPGWRPRGRPRSSSSRSSE
jgi:ATP phosphoribosyltransferase